MKIHIVQGNIVTFIGDAIVNAANVVMLGGGGVDGAIHRAAGPELYDACFEVPADEHGIRCPTGEARITPGFNLPVKYVIHTVGPIFDNPRSRAPRYSGEFHQENPRALLASAIRSSLRLAEDNGIKTLAMPSISCGVFGCTIPLFVKVASEVLDERDWALEDLTFMVFTEEEFVSFRQTWAVVHGTQS